jgi:hypothetical protein
VTSLLKFVGAPWEQARFALQDDLFTLEAAINKIGLVLGVGNTVKASAIPASLQQRLVPQSVTLTPYTVPLHAVATFVFQNSLIAATLNAATPGAAGTGDDGITYGFYSDAAFAHTITFSGGTLDSGGAAVTTATFNASKGASLTVMAFNGRYKVSAANGVSFS